MVTKSAEAAAPKALIHSLGLKEWVMTSTRKNTPASGAETAALRPAAIPAHCFDSGYH